MTTRAFDVQSWLHRNDVLATHAARIAGVLVLAVVVRALLHRAVDRLIRTALTGGVLAPLRERARATAPEGTPLLSERRRQRTQTLGSLLRSTCSVAVLVVAGAMVLSELGLDLTAVVASAGIVGVAIAFGAQNVVRDVVSGVLMLLEDQYGVGDVIEAGLGAASACGTVEAVSLRTTRLRDVDGTVWHVRNGEITRIGNRSQGWSRAFVDVPLDRGADVAAAREALLGAARALADDPAYRGKVVEAPEVWGVESLGREGAVLRVAMKTSPMEQGAVERALRERVVEALAPKPTKRTAPRKARA